MGKYYKEDHVSWEVMSHTVHDLLVSSNLSFEKSHYTDHFTEN